MPQNITKYRIVIASPGDVNEERIIANEVITSINNTFGNANNLVIETVKWETHSTPGLGRGEQNILDDFGEFDIMVGIMWKRFGSPTGVADSGTEEEFDYALNLYQQEKIIDIMFYFKQSGGEFIPTQAELKQIEKVLEFKKKVQVLSLSRDYNSKDEFKSLLREHLERKIQKIHNRELNLNFNQVKRQKIYLSPNYWNNEDNSYLKSFTPNYFSKYQCIPILKKTNLSENAISEIYRRLVLAFNEKESIWIDDNKMDEFSLIYVNTSVLYFLMQLGLDIEDTIIKNALKYLDNIKEMSIDKRAKWFFDIQTNRISQTNCLKFIELIEQVQIKEDVPTNGAFLFSQASTNEKNWQTYHSGGFSFHACHIADVLLHLSPKHEVARNKARLIFKGIASFFKSVSEKNNGFLLDFYQNKSQQLTIWYYVLSERIGIPLVSDWESNVLEVLSKDESNILRKSFLTMNLAILINEHSKKMKLTTIKSIFEYFDTYYEELNVYLLENALISNRDLSIFGRALLYCNFAIGNDMKNIYKIINKKSDE